MKKHPASSDLFMWLQGLSGFFTTAKNQYGSFAEMIEHPDWDEGRTDLAINVIGRLREQLQQAEKELSDHVNAKFG